MEMRWTITVSGVELSMGRPGRPQAGLFPGLHFTNIYGELLCARLCAGHWGHRDEQDTLSTHPCSSLPSPLPLGAQSKNPALRGPRRTEPTTEGKAWPGSWESEDGSLSAKAEGPWALPSLFPHCSLRELDMMTPLVLTHSDRW